RRTSDPLSPRLDGTGDVRGDDPHVDEHVLRLVERRRVRLLDMVAEGAQEPRGTIDGGEALRMRLHLARRSAPDPPPPPGGAPPPPPRTPPAGAEGGAGPRAPPPPSRRGARRRRARCA